MRRFEDGSTVAAGLNRWHGKPLNQAVVERMRKEGVGGRILQLSIDLPVVIEIVDAKERIDRILPMLDEMVGDGLVTLEKVHVITYRGTPKER